MAAKLPLVALKERAETSATQSEGSERDGTVAMAGFLMMWSRSGTARQTFMKEVNSVAKPSPAAPAMMRWSSMPVATHLPTLPRCAGRVSFSVRGWP